MDKITAYGTVSLIKGEYIVSLESGEVIRDGLIWQIPPKEGDRVLVSIGQTVTHVVAIA